MFNLDSKYLEDLGPEVYSEVKARIDSGERISAVVQAGLVLFLLLVWFISPRAVDSMKNFEAIPTVLIFYGPILLLRLYWSFKGSIPETTSILLTVIDISAITTIIFLYHIQYSTGPSLSLKSPTFLFLIVVIATRSLCFRASLVMVATVVAAGLWGLLTYFAVHHPETVITRSFVEYSSTTKVLVGAEVEKVLALFAIGGTLVLGVRASLGVLVDAVVAAEQRKSLSLFFSPEISEKIRLGQIEFSPGKGEHCMASVLFVDLRGFTKLAQTLDPNSVLNILTEYQRRLEPVIRKNNGTIDKYMGDGILIHFGAVSPTSSYARDAILTINEILQSIDRWNEERVSQGLETVDVNMAAAVGTVVFGATGSEKRLEMTIIGQAVNLAAKLEKFNKELNSRAVVTAKLLSQAVDQGLESLQESYKEANAQCVPGLDENVDLKYLSRS